MARRLGVGGGAFAAGGVLVASGGGGAAAAGSGGSVTDVDGGAESGRGQAKLSARPAGAATGSPLTRTRLTTGSELVVRAGPPPSKPSEPAAAGPVNGTTGPATGRAGTPGFPATGGGASFLRARFWLPLRKRRRLKMN